MTPERWQQVEQLYHAVREREPGEHAWFLDENCKGDDDLRREVESLLAAEQSSNTVLEHPAWEAEIASIGLGPGTQLGSYRIETVLGEGGMGVVYRALDTKLKRPVAVKLLSGDLADRAARRRFQREAQMASSLNHPHILTVYDAGELEGRQYLVTEFVDGGTLTDWAGQEKRTWRQIVDLLIGVADGLAAAHSAGILHRDLKPANILVARNGYAKLADFGLAKLTEGAVGDSTRTLTEARTRQGFIVGTVAYMSPEQASGKPLDARSDIFSFGIVLYELLAGKRPFSGASDLEVLHAIIRGSFPPLPEEVPLGLRAIVDKALENDPAERYQTMREVVVDLRRHARQKVVESAPATIAPTVSRRSWLWGAAAALVSAAGIGTWMIRRPASVWENPLANAQFTRFTDFEGAEIGAAISPDGKFVAFLSDREGPFDVWLSQVGSGRFVNLTQGKEEVVVGGTRQLGFSADGSEIWLSGPVAAGNRILPAPARGLPIRLVPLMGGPARPFLQAGVVGLAWSPDGNRIVYHRGEAGDPMFVADRTGANVRQIFVGADAGVHCHYPIWSPDGQWIYFVSGNAAANQMDLWRISPDGGQPERMTQHNGYVADPAPIGRSTVLYIARADDGTGPWLYALDAEQKITHRVSVGLEQYTSVKASADGRRLVASVGNQSAGLWRVPILDHPAGESEVARIPLPTVRALAPRFGGGTLFYLSSLGGNDGLWSNRDGRTVEIWRGSDGILLEPPAISADGSRVAVLLRRQGKVQLHLMTAQGAGLQALAETLDARGTPCWSPDGKWIAVGGSDTKGPGLFKVPADGGAPLRLADKPGFNPVWSPDGTLIVYVGPVLGRLQQLLAVRPDGTAVELPDITTRYEGERHRFLPGGRGLVYMQGVLLSQDFWLLDLATNKTRLLVHFTNPATMRTFDITPDGKQIVFDRLRDNFDIVVIDLPR